MLYTPPVFTCSRCDERSKHEQMGSSVTRSFASLKRYLKPLPLQMVRSTRPCKRTLVLYSFIFLSVLSLCPATIWRTLIENASYICVNLSWSELIESSTLYCLLDVLKTRATGTLGFIQPNSLKSDDKISNLLYHHILNEVVRIHRGNQEIPHRSRELRKASKTQRAEASQSLKVAETHHSRGQFLKAKKLLDHAYRLDPDNTAVLIALGKAFEGSWVAVRGQHEGSVVKMCGSGSLVPLSEGRMRSAVDDLILTAEHMYTKALIVDPRTEEAGQSRKRLMPLVEEIDQRRFNLIDLKVRRFYNIPESNAGFRRAKVEQYFKHIYHSNAIEGNTLTLAQTRSILETRIAVGGKSLLEQNEVLGLDAALRYINSSLLRGRLTPITIEVILDLHRHVLSFVDPSEAGHLRRTQVFIADHQPPPADAVPSLMQELVAWMNSDQLADVHPIEIAALTHWKFVYIHPFYDGNGRTARLLMNLILMRAGLPPAIIDIADRPAYYEHLKTANDGDVRPFIRFIASCTEKTIDEYLSAAYQSQLNPEDTERHRPIISPTSDAVPPQECTRPYHLAPKQAVSGGPTENSSLSTDENMTNMFDARISEPVKQHSSLPRVIYV